MFTLETGQESSKFRSVRTAQGERQLRLRFVSLSSDSVEFTEGVKLWKPQTFLPGR